MNNAKISFFAVIFFLLALDSFATSHSTTFDNRPVCEEAKGVWREFGNSCTQDCEHIFNQYKICPNSITFGCDCGEGRCWLDNKCVAISEYKITYREKVRKEKEDEEKLAKERDEKIKNDPRLRAYLYDIYKLKERQAAQNAQAAQNQQNNQTNKPAQNQQNNNPIAPAPQEVQLLPTQPMPNQPVAIPQIGSSSIVRQVPPAFIEQEKQKQAAQQQDHGITPLLQDPKTGETIQLPVVPLPQ